MLVLLVVVLLLELLELVVVVVVVVVVLLLLLVLLVLLVLPELQVLLLPPALFRRISWPPKQVSSHYIVFSGRRGSSGTSSSPSLTSF